MQLLKYGLFLYFGFTISKLSGAILPYNAPFFSYEGRYQDFESYRQIAWSGSQIETKVRGTGSLMLKLQGGGNKFKIRVGTSTRILNTNYHQEFVEIANLNQEGFTTVSITKITEADFFCMPKAMNVEPVKIFEFETTGNLELQQPRPKLRSIEILGDSTSTGYSIYGTPSTTLSNIYRARHLEDFSKGYAGLLRQEFDAKMSVIAISGKGVLKNAVGVNRESFENMPYHFHYNLPSNDQPWDFKGPAPDLFILYLGANDFKFYPKPSPEEFKKAYIKTLQSIRAVYQSSETKMLAICAYLQRAEDPICEYISEAFKNYTYQTKDTSSRLHVVDFAKFEQKDWGGLGHLNVSGHQKLAASIKPVISKFMDWNL